MKRQMNWTCSGFPHRSKFHLDQHSAIEHAPYQNHGPICVICGLKKAAVVPRSLGPVKLVAAGTIGIIGLAAAVSHLRTQNCSSGQQLVDRRCLPMGSIQTTQASSTSDVSSTSATTAHYHTLGDVPNVPKTIVRYGGSTTFAPLRASELGSRIQIAYPGFELNYIDAPAGMSPGSTTGIQMLIEGQLSFSESSRSLKEEEYDAAKSRNFTLEQHAVAIDGVAIFVNSQLSLPGLTVAQLKGIYTGRITNWKEVGGPELAIVPFSRSPIDGGTPEFFYETVLNKEPFALAVRSTYARNTTEALRKVATTPGAIGYATASEVCNQKIVRTLPIAKNGNPRFVPACDGERVSKEDIADDSYPLTRRLFVVIKKDGSLNEQAGIAYVNLLLSDEGQRFITQVGLVPIR